MDDKKFAGRIMLKGDDDSRDAIVTMGENDDNEVFFSTEEQDGDYYLVLKKEDITKIASMIK